MKTFLSIGSGPGIGVATAERFAREGFELVLTGRTAAKLETVAASLREQGFSVETATLDASDTAAVSAFVTAQIAKLGAIDVLHYNAASLRHATLAEQPTDTLVADLATNIGGALAAIQAAQPSMIDRGEGTILLTGGALGFFPSPDYLTLSIGKAGVRTIALGLFKTLRDKGVHIGIVNVATLVKAGSQMSRDIAEEFWKLHNAPKDTWVAETTFPARKSM